jgi:hypothetical protein
MSHLLLVSLFVKNGVSLGTRQTKGPETPGSAVWQAPLRSSKRTGRRPPIHCIKQSPRRPRPARAAGLPTPAVQAV